MSYFGFLFLGCIGVFYGIRNFWVRKYKVHKNIGLFTCFILSFIIFIICCLDLPTFICGGLEKSVQFETATGVPESVSNGRNRPLFHLFEDSEGNKYWSSSVDSDWLYHHKFEKTNVINYLPITRSILYINQGGREIYNHWEGIIIWVLAGMILLFRDAFKEIVLQRK